MKVKEIIKYLPTTKSGGEGLTSRCPTPKNWG
jgi:hypothetical protein